MIVFDENAHNRFKNDFNIAGNDYGYILIYFKYIILGYIQLDIK